jgi:rhomboid protease GluP
MCPHCRAFITNKDRVCPYCNEPVGPRYAERVQASSVIGGFIPHARFNTMLILLVNGGLFVATVLFSMKMGLGNGFSGIDSRVLIVFGAKVGLADLHGEWWRLVTAGFLHGGIFHILMNSWVLFDLGAQVEEIYGASRMWVIYFCANFFGFLVSAWWNPAPSIGASAGLCGLIGAMIALGVRHRTPMGDAIRGMYIRWAVYILLMGLLPFFNIDNAAHLGGLAGGFALAYVAQTPGRADSGAEGLWRAAAWLCIVLTLVSFLKMWLSFSQMTQ